MNETLYSRVQVQWIIKIQQTTNSTTTNTSHSKKQNITMKFRKQIVTPSEIFQKFSETLKNRVCGAIVFYCIIPIYSIPKQTYLYTHKYNKLALFTFIFLFCVEGKISHPFKIAPANYTSHMSENVERCLTRRLLATLPHPQFPRAPI